MTQPKIDRICLTTAFDGKLKVEKATYTGDVTPHIAETGFEQPGRLFALAHYALRGVFMYHPDLKKARGADMTLMSKTLTSSVHVPVILEGKPATVNFWSKEKHGFPKAAQEKLRAVGEVVARGQ